MHELSIAQALLKLVEQHRPDSAQVEAVRVQVGSMQAIVPEAMTLAWEAATMDTEYAGCDLQLAMLPWKLRCLECGRQWEADTLDATCECSSTRCIPVGGDELQLEYIEIADPVDQPEVPLADKDEASLIGDA